MDNYIQKLRDLKARTKNTPKEIDAQHNKNRLTAQERLDLLLDAGSFNEIDSLVQPCYENYLGGNNRD